MDQGRVLRGLNVYLMTALNQRIVFLYQGHNSLQLLGFRSDISREAKEQRTYIWLARLIESILVIKGIRQRSRHALLSAFKKRENSEGGGITATWQVIFHFGNTILCRISIILCEWINKWMSAIKTVLKSGT